MKKLQIAFVVDGFPVISETFILNQIIDLIDRGHKVDIYAKKGEWKQVHQKVKEYNLEASVTYLKIPNNRFKRLLNAAGIFLGGGKRSILLLKTFNVFSYGRSALSLRAFFMYARFLNKPDYDIIHAHYGGNGVAIAKMKKDGFLRHSKLVTTFHGYDINPQKINEYKEIYKLLFSIGNLFTVNSSFTGDLLLLAGCPKEKIMKMPVGLNTRYCQPNSTLTKSNKKICILFCGRLIPFKAPQLVVEIARKLVFQRGVDNVKFFIIGDGVLKKEVGTLIAEYGLSAYIEMMGSKTQEEIVQIMSSMDIFLYPGIVDKSSGRVENQGLVLQEAQAMKLPVVASRVGGIPEGMKDNETGFLVDEGDIEMFAFRLETLVRDRNLRISMGEAGRNYVTANYDSRLLGDLLEGKYYQLLTE